MKGGETVNTQGEEEEAVREVLPVVSYNQQALRR